jgi:hypothetical protein
LKQMMLPIAAEKVVPTRPVSIEKILSAPHFALGVADAGTEHPYRDAYQVWHAALSDEP